MNYSEYNRRQYLKEARSRLKAKGSSDAAEVVAEVWRRVSQTLTSNLFLVLFSAFILVGPDFLTEPFYYPFFFLVMGFSIIKGFFPEMPRSGKMVFSIGLGISLFVGIDAFYRWLSRSKIMFPFKITLPLLSIFHILVLELSPRDFIGQKENDPVDQ
jgi:hypothetical protein